MTIETIKQDIEAIAKKIGVEADHLAHAIRQGLEDLVQLAEKDPEAARAVVADAQPVGNVSSPAPVADAPSDAGTATETSEAK